MNFKGDRIESREVSDTSTHSKREDTLLIDHDMAESPSTAESMSPVSDKDTNKSTPRKRATPKNTKTYHIEILTQNWGAEVSLKTAMPTEFVSAGYTHLRDLPIAWLSELADLSECTKGAPVQAVQLQRDVMHYSFQSPTPADMSEFEINAAVLEARSRSDTTAVKNLGGRQQGRVQRAQRRGTSDLSQLTATPTRKATRHMTAVDRRVAADKEANAVLSIEPIRSGHSQTSSPSRRVSITQHESTPSRSSTSRQRSSSVKVCTLAPQRDVEDAQQAGDGTAAATSGLQHIDSVSVGPEDQAQPDLLSDLLAVVSEANTGTETEQNATIEKTMNDEEEKATHGKHELTQPRRITIDSLLNANTEPNGDLPSTTTFMSDGAVANLSTVTDRSRRSDLWMTGSGSAADSISPPENLDGARPETHSSAGEEPSRSPKRKADDTISDATVETSPAQAKGSHDLPNQNQRFASAEPPAKRVKVEADDGSAHTHMKDDEEIAREEDAGEDIAENTKTDDENAHDDNAVDDEVAAGNENAAINDNATGAPPVQAEDLPNLPTQDQHLAHVEARGARARTTGGREVVKYAASAAFGGFVTGAFLLSPYCEQLINWSLA